MTPWGSARVTLGNPFAYPGINISYSVIYVEMSVLTVLNQYVCTGEHLQSDLDIFQFDFMFVKPHDVPPLLCFHVQTEMRFGVEQLLFPGVVKRSCSTPNLISVCTLKREGNNIFAAMRLFPPDLTYWLLNKQHVLNIIPCQPGWMQGRWWIRTCSFKVQCVEPTLPMS